MNKQFLLIIICLVFLVSCKSSADKQVQQAKAADSTQINTEKLKAQAQELADAMIAGNYERAIDLMYPKLVELSGGREKLRAGLQEQMKQLEIVSTKVGEPRDVFQVDDESYAIISSTIKMKLPEGILESEGHMVGFSRDKGEHWTFVNAVSGPGSKQQLKTLFPKAADKITIPAQKEPVLRKDATPQ
jgi:hypothetical protein